ncbi:MAG: bidirectional hydrogenase complex protein HoxE [Helicobacteraceae bacterium]|jgi:bidirectional [NiFe] hydrogenase diaphorase subunit|nr:bidirectional hydrogenase complex protein HoxE [Helicobacteraceae bacterium]
MAEATTIQDTRYKQVDRTMRKLGYEKSALIEALHVAQEVFGYLENDVLGFIAAGLRLPQSKVYGVATFYKYFQLKPKGKHACVVCTGTACYIKGASKLIEAMEKKYKIKPGETTEDGEISLLTARCFGSCSLAAVAVFDKKTAGYLNEESVIAESERMLNATNA